MEHAEYLRLLKGWRGRRLLACRAVGQLSDVIAALSDDDGTSIPPEEGLPTPPSAMQRTEMRNIAASLLRMVLLWNDGHVSPQELRRF